MMMAPTRIQNPAYRATPCTGAAVYPVAKAGGGGGKLGGANPGTSRIAIHCGAPGYQAQSSAVNRPCPTSDLTSSIVYGPVRAPWRPR